MTGTFVSACRVLSIAGSDPSGGAGIQADLKTITALGAYGATAITALTVQNTLSVTDVMPLAPDFVAAQMRAVIDDIGVDAIKIGMLGSKAVIEVVAEVLQDVNVPIVLDPVMVSTSGNRLLDLDAVNALKSLLFPLSSVITPNIPEAEALTEKIITNVAEMENVARELMTLGPKAVLMKGGHLPSTNMLTDVLLIGSEVLTINYPKQDSRHTHGTGCTLSSAIAVGLGRGNTLEHAWRDAHDYVQHAIRLAPKLGAGHGPLGHAAAARGNDG